MQSQEISAFKVYTRVRPMSQRELGQSHPFKRTNIMQLSDDQIIVKPFRGVITRKLTYEFDMVYSPEHSTTHIFQSAVLPIIPNISQGYNATCFAYGPTGSGKTHTMFGDIQTKTGKLSGIVYLAIQECLRTVPSGSSVKISYLELYNEQVKDLFSNDSQRNIMIVEDPARGVIVPELTEVAVADLPQIRYLIETGNRKRTMAATGANQFSSRSHAIMQVTVEIPGNDDRITVGKLCLIDLAGSERAAATNNRGIRMVEGANINRSLLALGTCINILSDPKKRGCFIPYRDSKLTRLLKDSLGGNSQTVMIACISPAGLAYEETMHTLNYASRARNIKMKISRNERVINPANYESIIASLQNEIEGLRRQLSVQEFENSDRESPTKLPTPVNEPIEEEKEVLPIQPTKEFSDIRSLSSQLLSNFEENWEIKQSIGEIDALNTENQARIKLILEEIESARENMDDSIIETLQSELTLLQETIHNNESTRSDLLQQLNNNLKQKADLQESLESFSKVQRREIYELQISVRSLKLEKLELHALNIRIKEQARKAQKQSEEKDVIISKMQEEIDMMKKQLSQTPKEEVTLQLDQSLSIVSKKSYDSDRSETWKSFLQRQIQTERQQEKKPPTAPVVANSALTEARFKHKVQKLSEGAEDTLQFISSYKNFKPSIQSIQTVKHRTNSLKTLEKFTGIQSPTVKRHILKKSIAQAPNQRTRDPRPESSEKSNLRMGKSNESILTLIKKQRMRVENAKSRGASIVQHENNRRLIKKKVERSSKLGREKVAKQPQQELLAIFQTR